MRFGSLFAGIGGFDLGLERAGMTCEWQVEKDEFCNRVLAKHWPDVPRYSDVRECAGLVADANVGGMEGTRTEQQTAGLGRTCQATLAPVDLICGGFPCQPFSQAGKRTGKADDRDLWPEMARLIEELRPAWVVGENVAGFITMELDRTLSNLEDLGYACRAFVIPACAVAAPHQRQRVWIVAHADTNGTLDHGRRRSVSDLNGQHTSQKPQRDDEQSRTVVSDPLADADGAERQRTRRTRNGREEPADYCGGFPQYGLGRMVDGFSHWLDEPDETPRIVAGQPDRINRLKALGNAVVPQVVEEIGRAIVKSDGIQSKTN